MRGETLRVEAERTTDGSISIDLGERLSLPSIPTLAMITQKGLAKENADVDCSDQRAVVAGGTQGIGAGIALRFALAGADVWIIGRGEQKAKSVLDQLRLASAEAHRRNGKTNASSDHQFFQADLRRVEDIERVANDIKKRAGSRGIDYLVETQGGPPNGRIEPPASSRSPEPSFAVQVASRFGLAYLLTADKTIKKAICMVAAPASGGSKPLDVDDLDFLKAKEQGKAWTGLMGIPSQGQRESSVLDSVCQTLAERNPDITVSHLFPGLIATNAPANRGFAWPFVQAYKVAGWIGIASSPMPGGYAEVPFYLLAGKGSAGYLRRGEANLLGATLARWDLSSNVRDPSVRARVWDKMASYFRVS